MKGEKISKRPKVIVIGLDGATWNLIKPWTDEGKLPTFKKLMEEGAWGELESTVPPVTAPAWASFLTGKTPGKTGIYDFLYLKEKWPPKAGVSSGFMIKGDNILTILSNHGLKVVSINLPMTYPPYPINGSIVSGIETPRGKKFAYPDRLYNKLVKEGYFPEPDVSYLPGKEKEYLSTLYLMIEKRNRLLFDFLDDGNFDLLLFLFRETDQVAHTFWRYMDKDHPLHPKDNQFKNAIFNIYKKTDELLRKILECKDDDSILIVLSDHGFGPEYFRINLNKWFLNQKYITLKNKFKVKIKKLISKFVSPAEIWNVVAKLGSTKMTKIKRKETMIGGEGVISKLFLTFSDVDWERTKAYSIGCIGRHLPVFIDKTKLVSLDKIRKDILLINNYLGKMVVRRVIDTEDVYKKRGKNILPELFVEFNTPYAGYTLPPPYLSEGSSIISKSPLTQSGAHENMGILIAVGGRIKHRRITNAKIIDLAPTILALFGIEPPKDMDGKVLTEIVGDVDFKQVKEKEKFRIKQAIKKMGDKQYI